jgi:hypothetical protein
MGLMAIPFLDSDPNRGVGYYSVKERPFASAIFLTGIASWFTLITIGNFMRGPNWQWYWPWESWLMHKPPPPPTSIIPLALGLAMLGIYFAVGLSLPALIKRDFNIKPALVKVLGCCVGLAMIFGVLPMFTLSQGAWIGFGLFLYLVMGILLPSKYLKNISRLRYVVCMALLLLMIGVFLKITLRLGFNIKYIVSIPQVSFNI